MREPRTWNLHQFEPDAPTQALIIKGDKLEFAEAAEVIELEPLLDHLDYIQAEDPESHAGLALGALLRFHGRVV